MKQNIKYSLDPEETGDSFFFDHVHTHSENQLSLHQQNSWELSYIITGRGVRVIGDTIEPFTEGEVILIPPLIPHCWSFDETVHDNEGKIENITVAFSNKLLEGLSRLFNELDEVISVVRQNENAISFTGETLVGLQDNMRYMVLQSKADRISILIKLLNLIASSESANIVGRPVNEDRKTRKIQNIYLYVMNNYPNPITLDEVAGFAGMERASFCVFFKKMTGKSFFAFLTAYRIDSSCQMLKNTSLSIAEICIASGFRDIPYYNRVFKKIKTITPTEYRKNYSQVKK